VPPGYALSLIASAPPGSKLPDDLARLNGVLYTGYQNGVPSKGPAATGPANSTLLGYMSAGHVRHSWSLRGKIDGLAADSANDRLIVTVNEDANSSLYVIKPSARAGRQVAHYTYLPDPASAMTGGVLTGGGTDAVAVLSDGTIIVTASAPGTLKATAAFRVTLSASSRTAKLKRTFADDAKAKSGLTGSTVTLGLTDPDSNSFVPTSSPLYGGQFVVVGQADQQLVFAKGIGHRSAFGRSSLTQLPLSHAAAGGTMPAGVDDVRWTGGSHGTLFVVDEKGGTGSGAIYKITGPFSGGEAFASLDTVGAAADTTEVDSLNLATGLLSPFGTGFGQPKGLLWVAG
jgi:hypothetical protein